MFRSRRLRGQLLIEMLIALGMLSLILILVFSAFTMSTRIFSESLVRQSAEQQLKSIRLLLERDLELTNFWLVGVHSPVSPSGPRRDALSLVTLSQWDDASLFEPVSSRPAWNRYVVWYATKTGPGPGRLVRQVLNPPLSRPDLFYVTPFEGLSTGLQDTNPESNRYALYTRYLSESVADFQASSKLGNGTVKVKLHLVHSGGKRALAADARVEDNLEVSWSFRPKNTWPPI